MKKLIFILTIFACQLKMELPAAYSQVLSESELSVLGYPTIQEAIDANPNRVLNVPSGVYRIQRKIQIRGNGSGLLGPGQIVQENPDEPIIEIENATEVVIRDLTLTRQIGVYETQCEAVLAMNCRDLALDNIRVIDNQTRSAAIALRNCKNARISNCLVRN